MLNILILILGIAICGAVCFHLALTLVNSMEQLRLNRVRGKLAVDLLQEQVNAAAELYRQRSLVSELSWNGHRKFVVKRIVRENPLVSSIHLTPHDGKALPPFKPGQYLTFNLKIPGQEKPVVRCYSLSDILSQEGCYRISVKRVPPPPNAPHLKPGVSSTYFNETIQEGDILDVKAPSGGFTLEVSESAPIVLIAGGIGVTPLYTMLRALLHQGSDREVWLFYGSREGASHTFKSELREITRTHANVRVVNCFDKVDASEPQDDHFRLVAERLSAEVLRKNLKSNNYSFYLCGPPPMMESMYAGLEAWGVPESRIRFEAFGPGTVKKKTAAPEAEAASAKAATAVSATIKFMKLGKSLPWDPKMLSILELARANGISMASGCCMGNCGTCLVAVKSGSVKYAVKPTFELEAGTCLPCAAIPTGDLELDA